MEFKTQEEIEELARSLGEVVSAGEWERLSVFFRRKEVEEQVRIGEMRERMEKRLNCERRAEEEEQRKWAKR